MSGVSLLNRYCDYSVIHDDLLQMAGNGGPVTDEWSVTAKQMLLQFAGKIHLPDRY